LPRQQPFTRERSLPQETRIIEVAKLATTNYASMQASYRGRSARQKPGAFVVLRGRACEGKAWKSWQQKHGIMQQSWSTRPEKGQKATELAGSSS
jgi:hypothetical protein